MFPFDNVIMIVKTIVADDLTSQGPRAPTVIVLTQLSRNIPISALFPLSTRSFSLVTILNELVFLIVLLYFCVCYFYVYMDIHDKNFFVCLMFSSHTAFNNTPVHLFALPFSHIRGLDTFWCNIQNVDYWFWPWSFVAWWRHQMETFSALLAICVGNSPVPVNSPHKGQWRGALMFSLICTRINGWINNGEAGDLRRHRAHYDVTATWNLYLLHLHWPNGSGDSVYRIGIQYRYIFGNCIYLTNINNTVSSMILDQVFKQQLWL